MVNDYEIVHEDVIMKLFVQSLTENARDWYRALPTQSIHSWYDFQHSFKEQFNEKLNTSFMLSQFNSIKKGANESVSEFNVRFQKVMNKLLQVTRL